MVKLINKRLDIQYYLRRIFGRLYRLLPFFWLFNFPSIFKNTPNEYLSILYNNLRLKFWVHITESSGKFNYIFLNKYSIELENYENQKNKSQKLETLKANNIHEIIFKAKTYGCSYITNYLDQDTFRYLENKYIYSSKSLVENKTNFGEGVQCINSNIDIQDLKIFDSDIKLITKDVFGRSTRFNAVYQKLLNISSDKGDINTIQHIDRWLPAIKIFYFPRKVSLSEAPFGYIPFSHIINKNYLKEVKNGIKTRSKYRYPLFEINNPTVNEELFFTVPENTILLTFTNGIHRRTPFKEMKNNERHTFRFLFYDQFTKFDLLKNYVS